MNKNEDFSFFKRAVWDVFKNFFFFFALIDDGNRD